MKTGKLLIITLVSLLLGSSLMAQMVSQPLSWSSKVVHIEGNIYEVQAIGIFDIDKTDVSHPMYNLGMITTEPMMRE